VEFVFRNSTFLKPLIEYVPSLVGCEQLTKLLRREIVGIGFVRVFVFTVLVVSFVLFAIRLAIFCLILLVGIVALAGGRPWGHAEWSFGDFFGFDDDLGGLGFFGLHLLEVAGGDLEGVESEAGVFAVNAAAEQELDDVAEHHLNGVGVLEGREHDAAVGIAVSVEVEFGGGGAVLLMVVTKVFVFDGGRAALGSTGLDMVTTPNFYWIRRHKSDS
jgi:hypothetical protein